MKKIFAGRFSIVLIILLVSLLITGVAFGIHYFINQDISGTITVNEAQQQVNVSGSVSTTITEGNPANLSFSYDNTKITDSSSISVTKTSGDGSMTYSASGGTISVTITGLTPTTNNNITLHFSSP